MKRLAIVGGGSWGTALAIALSPRFQSVSLWVYEQDLAARMCETRVNDVYLPGFCLPVNVTVTGDLEQAAQGADVVLCVVPSHVVRAIYGRLLPCLNPQSILVTATKGIENGTLLRMSQVLEEVCSPRFPARVAVLSGPTFASEVAAGSPTALVAASLDSGLASEIQGAFSGPTFRIYTSGDPVGVEVGGAVKNVIAIGAGVCAGLGLGHNSVAALITRGLAEMSRLAVALGGKRETMSGLAGLGDLVLTCTGDLSRNRLTGIELAKGKTSQEIAASMNMVAEGVKTAGATVGLAHRFGVEMPIAEQMQALLDGRRSAGESIRILMERSLKEE